jgi:hypothetical protein
MNMSLRDWLQNGWLDAHQSSREEIQNLLHLADRDLRASQAAGLGTDWRFAIAYNAALQAATAVLAAAGFRAAREAHHFRVIQSLAYTLGAKPGLVRRLNAFRKKRNVSSYETGGTISTKEAQEMADLAQELREKVGRWIKSKHPELL